MIYAIYVKISALAKEINMNRRINEHLVKNLKATFNLERWREINEQISRETLLENLPWTLKRREKFTQMLSSTFGVDDDLVGTVAELSQRLDHAYCTHFWQKVWQPRTEKYTYTGWQIVDEIISTNPRSVLDVGCGYNQFKSKIPNLVGIDKYNPAADYMVDILDFDVDPGSYDAVLVFGSINFGEYEDVACRFSKVFDLTASGGRIYVRANPGYSHPTGTWIDIFAWDFAAAHRIAKDNDATLVTFKQDQDQDQQDSSVDPGHGQGNRLYFVYEK